ncbi:MAG: FAD binding domain-containing protein, partial [Burkholderiaceae bacterium]|nr:FAD binding domain-containing protein [Burkholderiaceae bacterium]
MQAFAYTRAATLADAAARATADDAKLLAGGQSLLAAMKLGLAAPQAVIDLGALPELRGIRVADGAVRIG